MSQMAAHVDHNHLYPSVVVAEDDSTLTVRVHKDLTESIDLVDGMRFLTMAFLKPDGDRVESWLPWAAEEVS